jgi:hypothetical protein
MTLPSRVVGWQRRLRDPALTVLLVVQVIVLFVVTPVAAMGVPLPPALVDVLLAAVIGVVLLITSSRAAIALAIFSVAVTFASAVLRINRPSLLNSLIGHAGSILGLVTLSYVISRAVFAEGRVTIHRIQGAIVLYLNFAILFTAAFRMVLELAPGAFHGIPDTPQAYMGNQPDLLATVLYFSFTTLTSTGYGDIVPVHPVARSLANLESILGQLYPATLLARVVTLEMQFRRSRRDRRD